MEKFTDVIITEFAGCEALILAKKVSDPTFGKGGPDTGRITAQGMLHSYARRKKPKSVQRSFGAVAWLWLSLLRVFGGPCFQVWAGFLFLSSLWKVSGTPAASDGLQQCNVNGGILFKFSSFFNLEDVEVATTYTRAPSSSRL